MRVAKFFIVGCPRSGTTLLQQALNRHSQIAIPPETAFFAVPRWSRRGRREHISRLNEDLGVALPLGTGTGRAASDRAGYEEMARQYLLRLDRKEVTHFGDKSPVHLSCLTRIRRTFPDAKIVCIYRDGRDVALSLLGLPWTSRCVYVNFALWRYCCWLQRWARQWRGLPVHFLRYEALALDPARELRAVTSFLGVPYEAQLTDASICTEGVPLWEAQWKGRARCPIGPARVGLWRDKLTPDQLGAMERWGGADLRELGYQLAGNARAPLPWLFRARVAARSLLWLATRPRYGRHKSLWIDRNTGAAPGEGP